MYDVAVARYEKPFHSLNKAVELAGGLPENLSGDMKVVVKPNFCVWLDGVKWPRYGVITTARVLEDVVALLKAYGLQHIAIVEGVVEAARESEPLTQLVAKGMRLDVLIKRYGVRTIDVHRGRLTRIKVGDTTVMISADAIEADYILNVPVLKTHAATTVSLGMKNLKGLLNRAGRQKFHNPNNTGLDGYIASLSALLPPSFTVIDGIYTLENGPLYYGDAHRSNLLLASRDLVSADKVGATLLGYAPQSVPHIALAAQANGRRMDLGDINILGDVDIRTALKPHAYKRLEWTASGDVPVLFENSCIRGIRLPEPGATMCTYCGAHLIVNLVMGILWAKNEGKFFDDIEILIGMVLEPTKGHKHTLLVGQCQVRRNSKNALVRHCVPMKGCPPTAEEFLDACKAAGIELPDESGEWVRRVPEFFMAKYAGSPDFDESFYRVSACPLSSAGRRS